MPRLSFQYFPIALLCFVLATFCVDCVAQDEGRSGGAGIGYQVVKPAWLDSHAQLNNLGIGIEQAAVLSNPSGILHVNKSLNAISTVRYIRLQWSLLEGWGDNEWNFDDLDRAIDVSVENGKQAAIAVMGHVPKLGGRSNYKQAIPTWYMRAAEARGPRCESVGSGDGLPHGCTYYLTDYVRNCKPGEICKDIWTFNHNDDEYIRQQVELIHALRERYDNPAWAGKIAYVDVRGGLGSWTEGHVDGVRLSGSGEQWPMPTYANKVKIADAYLAFDYLPVVANVRNGGTVREAAKDSQWVYLCQQAALKHKVVGWRTDGLDSTKYLIDAVFSAYPFMKQCWQQGPVYGELNGRDLTNPSPVNQDSWADGRSQYFALNKRLAAWHASGWNTKYHPYPGDPASYQAAIDEWRAIGGYRLGVSSASIPTSVDADAPFRVNVSLANHGTAPVYRRWYQVALRFHPEGGGKDHIQPLEGDLTTVMPGAGAVSFTASNQRLKEPGTYEVSIGVVQDPSYIQVMPLKLAHRTSDCKVVKATYWCRLGEMDVSARSSD